MKLYCNRYSHFKDPLVCALNCQYRLRCRDFALFYDANRETVDSMLDRYLTFRRSREELERSLPVLAPSGPHLVLEAKRKMAEAMYIWIGADDRAELVTHQEALKRAEQGMKPKKIYRVSQEMELRYQLVPRRQIEKAKREASVEEARARARRLRVVEDAGEKNEKEAAMKGAAKRRRAASR
jgi:hypothetical protein